MKIDISERVLAELIADGIAEVLERDKIVPATLAARNLEAMPAPEARHMWAQDTARRIMETIEPYSFEATPY